MVIRIARLRWSGHVAGMDEICMSRGLMYMHPEGLVGRPRSGWRDEVGKDKTRMGERSWWTRAMNRGQRRTLLKKFMSCSADDDDDDDARLLQTDRF